MADERNESGTSRMDLNLYLGLPRSPRTFSLENLGSDLALGSLPLSSSSTEESPVPMDPLESHEPYSPSRASYNLDLQSSDPLHPYDENPNSLLIQAMRASLGSDAPYTPSNAPYSPSNAHDLPVVQESDEQRVGDGEPILHDRASPPNDEVYMTYFPTEVSVSSTPRTHDVSSSREELLPFPEFRIRRLIEVDRRLRQRQFRPPFQYDDERIERGRASSPISEQLVHDIVRARRDLEANGKLEAPGECIVAEGSDDEMKEKNKSAANFECNVCLDMAKEPVVTSCGHLFCWSCLYQWLYLHSDHQECPVCKGEVIESNITPIYGRGSLGLSDEKDLLEKKDSGLKIPPRPRGNRHESARQQFPPVSRRLGEEIASSWRRLLGRRMSRTIFEGHGDQSPHGTYDAASHAPMTRMRARRIQREEGISESFPNTSDIYLPRESTEISQSTNSSLLFRNGLDFWQRLSLHGLASSDRVASIAAPIGRVVGRFASSSNVYAASTSTANNPDPPPPPATLSADQASASSTMAMIQGDVAMADALVEPNTAGSSRSYRRRGRSSISGSLDVDGALHARKRRR